MPSLLPPSHPLFPTHSLASQPNSPLLPTSLGQRSEVTSQGPTASRWQKQDLNTEPQGTGVGALLRGGPGLSAPAMTGVSGLFHGVSSTIFQALTCLLPGDRALAQEPGTTSRLWPL